MTGQIEPTAPVVSNKRNLSAIWFLPILALVLGGWLLFQHMSNAASEIRIHFENANGILVGKTRIKYQGVDIGKVTDIKLDEDVSGVYVIAEIEHQAAHMLKSDTKFWLVSAKASLSGISGLDTLFTGSYINMRPGVGEPSDSFIAADEQPLSQSERGLTVKLLAQDMGSVSIGSPVYYKKIQVGEVYNFRLVRDAQEVEIQLNIDVKYADLVKQNSRFWNVSGINADFSLSGIKVHTESLASIISGAIAFDSPIEGNKAPSNFLFKFYDDIEAAGRGAKIQLKLTSIDGINVGTPIVYKGFKAGKITQIELDEEQGLFVANAVIEPMFREQLSENTRFWLEKAKLTMAGVENLSNLIKGDFIAFEPANGNPMRTFVVSDNKNVSDTAMRVELFADDASGIEPGDAVYYRRVSVGQIQNITLNEKADGVTITLTVEPSFQHLIAGNTRFYKTGGISLKASLKGMELSAEPLPSLLKGGISLYNPDNKTKGNPLSQYRLYPDRALAELGSAAFARPLKVTVISDKMSSVTLGSPVYFRKLPVGEVSHYDLTATGKVAIELEIAGQYRHLITKNSFFWDVSGIDIKGGLSGLEIKTDSLLAIAAGGIAFDNKTTATPKVDGHFPLFSSFEAATQVNYNIYLSFARADNVKPGTQVRYKGIVIGAVESLNLNERNDNVQAKVKIKQDFADRFRRQGSQYWLVNAKVSLAGAENLDTVLAGPYIEALPGSGKAQTSFTAGQQAPLLSREQKGLSLTLTAPRAGSLSLGSPVYFRQIQVGEVTEFAVASAGDQVEISINIEPQYQHLVRNNSVFWQASGFNMDVGITGASLKAESLEAIIRGGISFATPDGKIQAKAKIGQRFSLEQEFKQKWLDWQPKIPR
ncbi:MlaD family protein [Motilimonas sp. E26]|uniref:MlaD family protein n=1 Tax=Motilimonas sp. E26 TaxID=2865674 RepID=UPI001E2B6A1D|nr:MlaD family protein [Motilimonas sp. E26]MCE0556921.1 MlaD family protein [Motilimonas sp. E26]